MSQIPHRLVAGLVESFLVRCATVYLVQGNNVMEQNYMCAAEQDKWAMIKPPR